MSPQQVRDWSKNEPGSHETLLGPARALVMALESPVGSIYSLLIAEVIGTPLR